MGYPDDPAHPGDPALLDVPTLCDRLAALGSDPVAAPARALGDVVRDRLVAWHHSRTGAHRGTSLYCKPVTSRDRERSCIEPATEEDAATDAACYARLALCEATGWHRIALHPLGADAAGEVGHGQPGRPVRALRAYRFFVVFFAPVRFPPMPPGFFSLAIVSSPPRIVARHLRAPPPGAAWRRGAKPATARSRSEHTCRRTPEATS